MDDEQRQRSERLRMQSCLEYVLGFEELQFSGMQASNCSVLYTKVTLESNPRIGQSSQTMSDTTWEKKVEPSFPSMAQCHNISRP